MKVMGNGTWFTRQPFFLVDFRWWNDALQRKMFEQIWWRNRKVQFSLEYRNELQFREAKARQCICECRLELLFRLYIWSEGLRPSHSDTASILTNTRKLTCLAFLFLAKHPSLFVASMYELSSKLTLTNKFVLFALHPETSWSISPATAKVSALTTSFIDKNVRAEKCVPMKIRYIFILRTGAQPKSSI